MVDTRVEEAITNIKNHIAELENKLQAKQAEIDKLNQKTENLSEEKASASEKLKQMEKDMAELSSVYEEMKNKKDFEINIQEVMRLYVILTEQVLDGSSHIKILTLLHGAKERMTKEEISKASGIQPAATLRAIFELRNNGLVDYDDSTERVKLVRRLFG
ncbi:MAG: winged helix-turn-helix transcriptional regulator [Candidatus Heimdallarchaeota archaeon]|nr:winged helix-turn-helix transcriptional regulator [Candidatus Heimdallarchaeota archaeon]